MLVEVVRGIPTPEIRGVVTLVQLVSKLGLVTGGAGRETAEAHIPTEGAADERTMLLGLDNDTPVVVDGVGLAITLDERHWAQESARAV